MSRQWTDEQKEAARQRMLHKADDTVAFGDEDMAKLRDEATKQAREEFRAIERKRILADLIAEEREKISPSEPEEPEEEVAITIDVPACCIINKSNDTGITINGREYIHGRTYSNKEPKGSDLYISASRAADVRHIMFRANANEKALGFPNRDMNQRRVIDARLGQIIPMPVVGGA